jgi:hypothetical protein
LRLLADENLNGDIVRGLLLRQPSIDIVRVQDVGLAGTDDTEILAWAAERDRIVVTHDRGTLPDRAYERVTMGLFLPGVFVIDGRFPVGQAVRELLLMVACSDQREWSGRVVHLPL